jgi:SulP family sulfate permease
MWATFLGDLSGGVIALLIALPYGLAMASLMGLPPVLGVYTSIITGPICVLLGRNPVLIGGTSSVTIPFIAAAVLAQGISGAAKVCISAGIIMLIFCVLRLGRYVAKVPHSVMAGFSCGIGGMMIISQMKTIFALRPPAGGWKVSMLMQLVQVLQNLGAMRVEPFLVALTVIVVATIVIYALSRSPAPLFGVVVALMVGKIFGWHEKEVGAVFAGLPSPVGFHWEPSDVWTVLPAAFGLAFASSVDLLMTSRVVDHFRGRIKQNKKHDADMELGAYGLANLIGGTFGAPTSVGIPARSLANVQCGATTAFSNLIHAAFLVGFLTLGTHFLSQIPLAALAGVTAWMGGHLLDGSTWGRLRKMRRVDGAAFVGSACAVLVVNAVAAIAIGCSCHIAWYIYRRYFPRPAAKNTSQPPLAA